MADVSNICRCASDVDNDFPTRAFVLRVAGFDGVVGKPILAVLTLLDRTLAANLLLIVLFSGYESFASKLDWGKDADKPDRMGTVWFVIIHMRFVFSGIILAGMDHLSGCAKIKMKEATMK